VDRGLRDNAIVVLRKALFDRSNEVKKIGMTGALLLLKTFKIKSSLPVSQLSQSSSGLLSQVRKYLSLPKN